MSVARPAVAGTARRRKGPLVWIVGAVILALMALLVAAVLRPADNGGFVALNRPAPDFTMSLYNGGKVNLKGLRGKTVVVNFWWSNCPPCVQEAPVLERQWRAWKGKGVVFLGVDEQDDPSSSAPRDFLRTYHVTYPNGWDPGDVDIQYGTTGQPETFFITPGGIMKNKYAMPFTSDAQLSHMIQEARS